MFSIQTHNPPPGGDSCEFFLRAFFEPNRVYCLQSSYQKWPVILSGAYFSGAENLP